MWWPGPGKIPHCCPHRPLEQGLLLGAVLRIVPKFAVMSDHSELGAAAGAGGRRSSTEVGCEGARPCLAATHGTPK